MASVTTLTAKIKETKFFKSWFRENSTKAAQLYNACLDIEMRAICEGKKILTAFDLANQFRSFELGSDYKDRIYERVATSISKWIKSERFRYEIYWQHKEKSSKKNRISSSHYPLITTINFEIENRKDYRQHILRLCRKQILVGKPRKRKTCSLAFSIRKNRQDTVQIKRNCVEIGIPKYKARIKGKLNLLPTTSQYQIVLVTLKKDTCGTFWFKITLEEEIKSAQQIEFKNVVVGIDMGLKTTRTVVAVNLKNNEILEIYQPIRVRYFEKGYQSLVWASAKDKRHLPFIHRKIARRRHDNIGKDICKIITMGDEFKFGKPNSAFLFSGRLARSAADAANSMFLTRFVKRAEKTGKKAGEVNESYTSVTCRKCLNKKSMPLSQRIYECNICSHNEDRDINSAHQIAFRDFLIHMGENKQTLKNQRKKQQAFVL